MLPVNCGVFRTGTAVGGTGTTGPYGFSFVFNSKTVTKTAIGYVLESAWPDKRFGNVWKANPTAKEIEDAADNISKVP